MSLDALVGYGDFGLDQTRTQFGATVSGSQDASAIFGGANLTFCRSIGDLLVDASTAVLYARMRLDAFTESNPLPPTGILENPSGRVRIGQWQIGTNVAYPYADLEIFGSAFYVYDFDRTEVSVGPTQAVPSVDKSEFQLGAGVRYIGIDDVIASLEYRTVQGRNDIDSDSVNFNLSFEFRATQDSSYVVKPARLNPALRVRYFSACWHQNLISSVLTTPPYTSRAAANRRY